MYRLEESITIDAPAERVWDILSDFNAYPFWNPFLQQIRCDGRVGSKVEVTMAQPGAQPMRFKPTLTEFEEGHTMEWLGRLGPPGLFDGRHRYSIEVVGANRVVFQQSEEFRGLLTPLFKRMIERQTREAFTNMNQALKDRAERPGVVPRPT